MLKCFYPFLIVFFGYFASLVLYFINFERSKDSISVWGRRTAAATLLLHLIFLLVVLLPSRRFAITSLSEYIYAGSFFILLASYFMESRYKTKFLMLFSLPIVLLFCLLAILLSQQAEGPAAVPGSGWLLVHTGLILSGFTGLVIAVAGAVMYLLQSSQLKSKHLGKIFLKLPSLGMLDKLHFTSLAWGVILFSLGILSGLLWAKNMQELNQILKDPKVILSFVTCLMYWVVLSFRLSALRRGQKIAVGTLLIFFLLFMTLMSSHYAPSDFHKGF